MTPTFFGRVQSRLFAILTAGLLWTLALTPMLPRGFATIGEAYATTLAALAVVAVVGVLVWDGLYHLLQQFRWEKDWPAMFTLLLGVPEGVVAYLVLDALLGVEPLPFLVHFATTWLVVFLCLHGPMRVVSVRWRFRGGRLL